jgi:hypothetical protein
MSKSRHRHILPLGSVRAVVLQLIEDMCGAWSDGHGQRMGSETPIGQHATGERETPPRLATALLETGLMLYTLAILTSRLDSTFNSIRVLWRHRLFGRTS